MSWPTVDAARRSLVGLHGDLVSAGLVAWTAGNISARATHDGRDVLVIKPSGVRYDELTAESMSVCELDGTPFDGALTPSSDTPAHAYVYRHRGDVGGVVHTHSPYATAWAARNEEIPCVLTAMADEFGGPIPTAPLTVIGDDSIGRLIVETLQGHRSNALLMANHGVFSIGRTAVEAVKAATMCEDVARSVHLARQLGDPQPIPQAMIDRLYERYQNVYGQR